MNPEKSTQPTRTLLHAHQPEPLQASVSVFSIEPLAIIADPYTDPSGRTNQIDYHISRLGMFGHILQTFLQHTKQVSGNLRRKRARHLTSGIPHGQPRPLRELDEKFSRGRFQADVFQQRGVQFVSQIVQVIGELYNLFSNGSDLSDDRLRWVIRRSLQALESDG